jgi:hypothetical protein
VLTRCAYALFSFLPFLEAPQQQRSSATPRNSPANSTITTACFRSFRRVSAFKNSQKEESAQKYRTEVIFDNTDVKFDEI